MITYTCDRCGHSPHCVNIHCVNIPHHIVNSHEGGYVDGMNEPTSGKTISFHLCSKCNNEHHRKVYAFMNDVINL